MREDLCSIPINDVFSLNEGCPLCTMRDMLEERMATYITGAAMMEPDVREETNRMGFCHRHFEQIALRGSKLSVALITESLLKNVRDELFGEGSAKKGISRAHEREESCFICENTRRHMLHLLDSMLTLWQSDGEFRRVYSQAPYICLSHYRLAMDFARKKMPKKNLNVFLNDSSNMVLAYLDGLTDDVTAFCRSFDYRNSAAPVRADCTAAAVEFLTSHPIEGKQKASQVNR